MKRFFEKKEIKPHTEALRITLYYGVLGSLWIMLSDEILNLMISNWELYKTLQTYKGWFYVLLTMIILYIIVKTRMEIADKAVKEAQESYHKLNQTYDELAVVEEELRQQFEELERHRDDLLISDQRYKLAVEGANDGIWDWDIKSNTMYSSLRHKKTFGYVDGDIENTLEAWMDLVHPEDQQMVKNKMAKYINSRKGVYKNMYRVRCKDGSYRWVLSKGKAIWDAQGFPIRAAGSHTDITDWKGMEQRVYSLAYYDTLTGLPNRSMFEKEMKSKLERCKRRGEKLGLISMNVDNFKRVNDTWGHSVGDELLRYIGNIMGKYSENRFLCVHLGGDEFAIIIDRIQSEKEVMEKLEIVLENFKSPWVSREKEVFISFSIGIAIYPNHGNDLEAILINANSAMEHVKEHGKDGISFYSHDMKTKKISYIQTVNQINSALENNEFSIYYQPQIDLESEKMVGVEALIRWNHPKKGLISPMEFIPLAEKTDQIHAIGNFVLEEVCRQKKKWEKAGYPPIPVSINISGITLTRTGLPGDIEKILESYGIDGKGICIEVTETAIMSDIKAAVNSLNELRKLGIKIALDDFGTGYSSLTYLKKLPIDILKIDREFIKSIGSQEDEFIVRAVIQLAHGLELEVVAEGVETKEQITFLLNSKCNQAQGYLFCKPVPPEHIESILNASIVKIQK